MPIEYMVLDKHTKKSILEGRLHEMEQEHFTLDDRIENPRGGKPVIAEKRRRDELEERIPQYQEKLKELDKESKDG